MPHSFQITVDCSDPHAQADWWALALGWEVEPQDESFIRSMIEQGHASEADTIVHQGRTVWKEGCAINGPEDASSGPRLRMLFQLVPEPKTTKNRIHLDVTVGAENVESEQSRLEAMGATFLHNGRQGPHTWVTMADVEGNEFCIR